MVGEPGVVLLSGSEDSVDGDSYNGAHLPACGVAVVLQGLFLFGCGLEFDFVGESVGWSSSFGHWSLLAGAGTPVPAYWYGLVPAV